MSTSFVWLSHYYDVYIFEIILVELKLLPFISNF